MRARDLILAVVIATGGTAVSASAQPGAAADKPAAGEKPTAVPAAASPTASPATPAAERDAKPAAEAATQDAPAAASTTEVAPATETAPAEESEEARAARILRQRAALQVMLARAREANQNAEEREREEPHTYGDAGAAFALGLSFDAPWYVDPGYDVFAEDDAASRFGVWLGYDVATLSEELIAAVELGWGRENDEGEALRVAETRLTSNMLYGGVNVRWVPISWLQPHVRLAVGAALIDGEVRAGDTFHEGGTGLFEDLVSPYGSAGLGFTLRTPTRTFETRRGQLASLSFGVMLEGGYTLAAPVDLELEGPKPRARNMPVAEPSLGELERSGPYIRVSLVGRL